MSVTTSPPAGRPGGTLTDLVPGIGLVRSYQRGWLAKDVVAGLVLSALLVPQGMAYAELAGLPPVTGLYTSILCLLGYAVFGPSRILVLGPDSSLGPMIAATIAPLALAGGDPGAGGRLASVLGAARRRGDDRRGPGPLRLRGGPALEADPDRLHERPGAHHHRRPAAQAPRLLGRRGRAHRGGEGFVSGVAEGLVTPTAAVIGVVSLVGILLLQRLLPKIPAVLAVVVLAALTVNLLDLEAKGSTRSACCRRVPPAHRPHGPVGDVPELFLGAVAIAVVALADTMSTASSFAARRGERVRGDQEMIGIGAANIAAGLFQGFPVSTSGSRTAVAEQAGSRSQVTGVVGAAVITFVLVFATELMQYVPQPTLGAIVIAAALSLADVAGDPAAVAAAPHRVHPLDRRAARRGAARRPARHPARDRPVDPQRVPAGVVAAPGRARPGRGPGRPARHRVLPPLRAACPASSSSASTHR